MTWFTYTDQITGVVLVCRVLCQLAPCLLTLAEVLIRFKKSLKDLLRQEAEQIRRAIWSQ